MTNNLTFGMPTLIEFDTLEQNAKLCSKLGLKFVEINMNLPQYQTHNLDASVLLNLQKKYNIFFTFHLPEDIDISHFNPKVRNAFKETVFETIELMKQIGSPIVNMHMSNGIYFTLPNERIFLFDKFADQYKEAINSFADDVEKKISGSGIKFMIENTGDYGKKFITQAVSQLISKKDIHLTWDIGHDYSSGQLDKQYVLDNLSNLKHMNLHDAIGINNHLALYDGEMEIEYYIHIATKNKLTVVIETKTKDALIKSVKALDGCI